MQLNVDNRTIKSISITFKNDEEMTVSPFPAPFAPSFAMPGQPLWKFPSEASYKAKPVTREPKSRARRLELLRGNMRDFFMFICERIEDFERLETSPFKMREATESGIPYYSVKTSYRRLRFYEFIESVESVGGVNGYVRLRVAPDAYKFYVTRMLKKPALKN